MVPQELLIVNWKIVGASEMAQRVKESAANLNLRLVPVHIQWKERTNLSKLSSDLYAKINKCKEANNKKTLKKIYYFRKKKRRNI